MHATEVGSAQHTINLGYDLIARSDPEFQAIRDRTIVVLVPSINPDGQNLVADWFNKNYGTPQEGDRAPGPISEVRGTRQQPRLVHAKTCPRHET